MKQQAKVVDALAAVRWRTVEGNGRETVVLTVDGVGPVAATVAGIIIGLVNTVRARMKEQTEMGAQNIVVVVVATTIGASMVRLLSWEHPTIGWKLQ